MIEVRLMNGEKVWINPHLVTGLSETGGQLAVWFGTPRYDGELLVQGSLEALRDRIEFKLKEK